MKKIINTKKLKKETERLLTLSRERAIHFLKIYFALFSSGLGLTDDIACFEIMSLFM